MAVSATSVVDGPIVPLLTFLTASAGFKTESAVPDELVAIVKADLKVSLIEVGKIGSKATVVLSD
jgi:hypothetical protein